MDLKGYEEAKFRLAEAIRAAGMQKRGDISEDDSLRRTRDLLARLADDRFLLVVVGHFSRGKSSLMNAIFGHEWLPTGIVPLTSVITSVSYGSSERVLLSYQNSGMRGTAKLSELPALVTQRGNPGNRRKIELAEIQVPAEILRRGFYFVDTPGLGSAIRENTRTTERFLPEADAFLLVSSYESPLSEDERSFLNSLSGNRKLFMVLNKQDSVSVQEREEGFSYVAKQVAELDMTPVPEVFSISARDALSAKQNGDQTALAESGLPLLEQALGTFLVEEKQSHFLRNMCERVEDLILDFVPPGNQRPLLSAVEQILNGAGLSVTSEIGGVFSSASDQANEQRFDRCEICDHVLRSVLEFLRKYQFDLSTRPDTRDDFANAGGFCTLHTWQYEGISSPRGTCTGFPPLLESLAAKLQGCAATIPNAETASALLRDVLADPDTCPVCRVRTKQEVSSVELLRSRLEKEEAQQSSLCLQHTALVLARMQAPERITRLLQDQAALLTRTSEDLQRYALKHDALRRYLASDEDNQAALRALVLLSGHRSLAAPWKIDFLM